MNSSWRKADAVVARLKTYVERNILTSRRGVRLYLNRNVQGKWTDENLGVQIEAGVMFLHWGSSRWNTVGLHKTVGVDGDAKRCRPTLNLVQPIDVPAVLNLRGQVQDQVASGFARRMDAGARSPKDAEGDLSRLVEEARREWPMR